MLNKLISGNVKGCGGFPPPVIELEKKILSSSSGNMAETIAFCVIGFLCILCVIIINRKVIKNR